MRSRAVVFVVVMVLLSAGALQGQSVRGSIGGTVRDANRAAVAGATVTLVHEETNKKRAATADEGGSFLLTLLPAGSYRLEVTKDGFRTYVQTVKLELNQEIRIDVPMAAGKISERVEVTTPREFLKTETAAVSTVIENRLITGLPLNGRNFYELSLLTPGTAPPAQGSAGSVRGDFAINVSGGREDANQFTLDGVYNGDPKLNGVGVTPPVDGIREFEVLTSTYDASFGRNAGGQISVALKNGTNGFHGTVYEFFRNNVFDARNFFSPRDLPEEKYQRNQFGGSLGGPIVKERTFFFADYEGRITREGTIRFGNVPTLAERTGDFSGTTFIPGFFPQPINPFTQQPFQDNRIPIEFQHPTGRAIAALFPAPNLTGDTRGNFVSSPALRDNEHQFDVRVDHALSEAGELAFRYSFSDRNLFEPFTGPTFSPLPGYGDFVPRRAQNLMASETHALRSNLLNELRFGYNRVAIGVFQENINRNLNAEVGLPNLSSNPRDFGLSMISIFGFSVIGDEFNNPQESTSDTFQLLDQMTWVRGRHHLKFGGDMRWAKQDAFRDVQSRGNLNFLPGVITQNQLADLLLGFPTFTGGAILDNPQKLRTQAYSLFVQDTFRVRPNLTLTLGLRYEYRRPPYDANDRANIFDEVTQTIVPVGVNGVPRGGYEPDRNNWAPRVGIAWSPGAGRKTVIRAGYGIYFDQTSLATGEGLFFNPPFFDFRLFFTSQQFPLTLSNPFPAGLPSALGPSATTYQRNLRTPYVQQWSLSVQQQLGATRTVEVAYVGSKGSKLLGASDINQPDPSPVFPNPRPIPGFEDIDRIASRASSTYSSMQVRIQQTSSFGLSLLASYTCSKSMDDASNFFASAGDPNFPQDSRNLEAERSRSNFDVKHRLAVSYAYGLPFGRGKGRLADRGWVTTLVSGWETYGIVIAQSGRPFTVALPSEFDNSNTGRSVLGFGANDRPDIIANAKLDHPTANQWFNTAAFVPSPFGTFGNSGRNILEGPGLATVNMSVVKTTALTEILSFQFRAEVFNLFNRANLNLPGIFVGTPDFGQITTAQSPRQVQFGVKFLF